MSPSTVLVDNRRWLWVVIYSRLGDPTSTEDVLQEVAVAAANRHDDFQETQSVKNWLYRVAVRQVLLFRRKQSRDRNKIKGYSEQLVSLDQPSCVQWICADETNTQVRAALSRLKPSDQQILAMKYAEDFSCKEIASVLGVAETTVQTRMLRARRRLRHILVNEYQIQESPDE